MQKIRKILRAVSEKTALPTNQLPTTPILYDLAHAGPTNNGIRLNDFDYLLPCYTKGMSQFHHI